MEFKDILAISGMPGLYKYVAQSTRALSWSRSATASA